LDGKKDWEAHGKLPWPRPANEPSRWSRVLSISGWKVRDRVTPATRSSHLADTRPRLLSARVNSAGKQSAASERLSLVVEHELEGDQAFVGVGRAYETLRVITGRVAQFRCLSFRGKRHSLVLSCPRARLPRSPMKRTASMPSAGIHSQVTDAFLAGTICCAAVLTRALVRRSK
jgi:hypothetical protein